MRTHLLSKDGLTLCGIPKTNGKWTKYKRSANCPYCIAKSNEEPKMIRKLSGNTLEEQLNSVFAPVTFSGETMELLKEVCKGHAEKYGEFLFTGQNRYLSMAYDEFITNNK